MGHKEECEELSSRQPVYLSGNREPPPRCFHTAWCASGSTFLSRSVPLNRPGGRASECRSASAPLLPPARSFSCSPVRTSGGLKSSEILRAVANAYYMHSQQFQCQFCGGEGPSLSLLRATDVFRMKTHGTPNDATDLGGRNRRGGRDQDYVFSSCRSPINASFRILSISLT